MTRSPLLEGIRLSLAPGAKAVILAYGSSNTERTLPGMHWFDIVELAIRDTYGRFHQCVNAGICGDTARGLLARLDHEAAIHRPRLAIITIGGNDSSPARGLLPEEFEDELCTLHRRFADLGCAVVFQTYYAPDPERQGDLGRFHAFMERVRSAAVRTRSPLIDHLPRWEAFRRAHRLRYLDLMQDGMHVNRRGNAVLGLDVARSLGAQPVGDPTGFWDEALEIQGLMDGLCGRPPVPVDAGSP